MGIEGGERGGESLRDGWHKKGRIRGYAGVYHERLCHEKVYHEMCLSTSDAVSLFASRPMCPSPSKDMSSDSTVGPALAPTPTLALAAAAAPLGVPISRSDDDDEESCPPPAAVVPVAAAAVAVAWAMGVVVCRSTVLRRMTGMAVLPITCSNDRLVSRLVS